MFSYLYFFISVLLDSTISNYIAYDINKLSFFNPLFAVVSISVLYLLYWKKDTLYLRIVTIYGIVYSFFFVGNIVVNMILFFLIGLFNIFIYKYVINNLINTVFICVLDIFLYLVLSYIIFKTFNIYDYSLWYLFNVIKGNIILNIIYCIISYKIISYICRKKSNIRVSNRI